MKTTPFSAILLAALFLSGCDADGIALDGTDAATPIGFSSAVTRAEDITSDNIASMAVFASYTGTGEFNAASSPLNYMYNQEISKNGSTWTYSPVKFWPNKADEKISFFAYAPKLTAGDGMAIPSNAATGTLSFTYTSPLNAKDQVDLLVADPVLNKQKSDGTIAFSFKHRTAKVKFEVTSSDVITVNSITVKGATNKRSFTLGRTFAWGTSAKTGDDFTYSSSKEIPADMATEVATFYLLATDDTPTVTLDYDQDGTKQELKTATLPSGWNDGDVIVFTLTLDSKAKLTVSAVGGTWGDDGSGDIASNIFGVPRKLDDIDKTRSYWNVSGADFAAVLGAINAAGHTVHLRMEEVTTIKADAFRSCTYLVEISMPNATDIGESAFRGCKALTKIDLSKATEIGVKAFLACTALTEINLSIALKIGNNAFDGCILLTEIDLPEATDIGNNAFYGCKVLATISLPKATTIGNSVFSTCIALTTIDLPVATTIGSYAFRCKVLTTIDLPVATTIGENAFYSCKALTTIDLPAATSIGTEAFQYCTALTTVRFGADISTWGTDVFLNATPGNIDLYLNDKDKPASGNTWNTYTFKSINSYGSNR